MSRFEVEKVRIAKTVTYFDFTDNQSGLRYRNWRLMADGNEVTIAAPYVKYAPNRYMALVEASDDLGKQWIEHLSQDILQTDLLSDNDNVLIEEKV